MVYILKEDNVVCEFVSFQTCWNHLEKGVMMADLKHFDLSMKLFISNTVFEWCYQLEFFINLFNQLRNIL